MSNIKKSELLDIVREQGSAITLLMQQVSVMKTQIGNLIDCSHSHTRRLIALEPDNPLHGKFYEPKPQLIEREKAELTGSDLCRAMLARGDRYVMCYLSHTSEESAKDVKGIVIGSDHSGFRVLRNNSWQHAIPINNQGEPLTANEVGL